MPTRFELVDRIRRTRPSRVLVNDIWGGRSCSSGTSLSGNATSNGLRLLRLGVDTHLITAPCPALMIERPAACSSINGRHRRVQCRSPGSPSTTSGASVIRMAWAHARDLTRMARPRLPDTRMAAFGMMLEAFGVTEENWRRDLEVPHFVISETPRFIGRAVAAAADRSRWNGRSLSSGGLHRSTATDLDGSRLVPALCPEVQDAGKPADAAGYR